MDYREERFDQFGFESPFAASEAERSDLAIDAGKRVTRGWDAEREGGADAFGLDEAPKLRGRLDDPKRDPAIEKDGTLFDVFLKGGDRAAFVQRWLAACPQLAQAAAEPHGDLKTGDIAKDWFVIHDVGVKSSLSDTRFKAKDTKKKSVHGFVNRAGNYAATHDFAKQKSGTIYEFVSRRGREIARGKTVNIETVPDIEVASLRGDGMLPPPSNADLYASIGFRKHRPAKGKVTYYKWTKSAFDVIASLYILASARAGQLLTLTAHKEMDRNLGRSVIWRELKAAELANPKGSLRKYLIAARDRPSDYHGDPYGFDFQALYDVITAKLNALGGAQMPQGTRYGIHPLRIRKADGEDITNGSSHKHEFPWQSDPEVKRDTGLKKAGWWKGTFSGEAFDEDEAALEDYAIERYAEEVLDPGHAFEDEVDLEALDYDTGEDEWTGENEEESLAWLDQEDETSENYLFEDEWEDAPTLAAVPTPLLGGQLWSSTDSKLGAKHAIFVSPAALGQTRAEVLLYVHGLLRPCGGLPKGGVAAFISEDKFALGAGVVASGRPIILIVPQFQDASDTKWSARGLERPAALNLYLERCLQEVGMVLGRTAPELSGLIVAGHSRAYGVLYPLARSNESPEMQQGPLARLSGLWFLDASYGGFPARSLAVLLKARPGLSVKQVYIAGSRTDSFNGRKRDGRLAYMPVSPRLSNHCQIPARTLADLLADRPLAIAYKPTARRRNFAPDYEHEYEGQYENAFALEDEGDEWSEDFDEAEDGEDGDFAYDVLVSEEEDENEEEDFDHDVGASEGEDEAERRCSQDEALFEGIAPFMESENWSNSTDQVAFRERVLAEYIKRTEKRKKVKAQPDLRDDQLATIPGTKITTRVDTAAAAGKLLAAANAALAAARAGDDAVAAKIRSISVTSGYRSASRQLKLWRGVFSAEGGYYDTTDARRQTMPGGPHSDAAIAFLLKPTGSGGFGLGGRIAAPGFSNHQSGTALDFLVNLNKGGPIKLSSKDRYRAVWRASWFHQWMKTNALTFGFHPISTEEWHWEYRPGTERAPQGLDALELFDDEFEPEEFESDVFAEDWEFEAASAPDFTIRAVYGKRNGKRYVKGYRSHGGQRVETALRRLRSSGKMSITDSDIDLLERISRVESSGFVACVQTYDSAYLSFGFMQYTILHDSLQKLIQRVPTAFARYGIVVQGAYSFGKSHPGGIVGAPLPRDLRKKEWVERFMRAGLDDDINAAQAAMALEDVAVQMNRLKRTMATKWSDALATARIRALVTEADNNRPVVMWGSTKAGIMGAARSVARAFEAGSGASEFEWLLVKEIHRAYSQRNELEKGQRLTSKILK